jgi:hypothetical protein
VIIKEPEHLADSLLARMLIAADGKMAGVVLIGDLSLSVPFHVEVFAFATAHIQMWVGRASLIRISTRVAGRRLQTDSSQTIKVTRVLYSKRIHGEEREYFQI